MRVAGAAAGATAGSGMDGIAGGGEGGIMIAACAAQGFQGLAVDLGMRGFGDAVLVAQLVGVNLLRGLLHILGQGEEGWFLGVGQVFGAQQVGLRPIGQKLGRKDDQQHEDNVDDDRDPESLALARARQIVLEFGQHVRHELGIIVLDNAPGRRQAGSRRRGGGGAPDCCSRIDLVLLPTYVRRRRRRRRKTNPDYRFLLCLGCVYSISHLAGHYAG